MFVIVDMSDKRKRIFEKYRRHEIELKRHDVCSCAPFFVAKGHRDYTDYNELKKIVECYGVALFAKGFEVPDILAPLEFYPTVLPLKMLVKTVAEYFSKQQEMSDLTVTVVDKSAKAGDILYLLAKNVRYVRVVTSRMDRYGFFAEKIYNSMGISVELTNDLSHAYGSDIVISTDDKNLEHFDKCKIISYKKHTDNPNVFALSCSDLSYGKFNSEEYGIDKYLFICALYETCGYHLKEIPIFKDISTLDEVINT